MSYGKAIWLLLREAAQAWTTHKAARLSAALAYFTMLSLSPLLIMAVAIAGQVYGPRAAESELMQQIENVAGEQVATAVQDVISDTSQPSAGIIASLVSLAVLLFGASNVFNQLQDALNTIWHVPAQQLKGIRALLWQRLLALGLVLGVGLLLALLLASSTVIAAVNNLLADNLPFFWDVLPLVDLLISLALLTVIFAFIFRLLPRTAIRWSDVWYGAGLTAVLFTLGKYLISLYLGRSSVGSAYGAAGSLVVILVWVYFSGQIFFFGAEFTRAYAIHFGSHASADVNGN